MSSTPGEERAFDRWFRRIAWGTLVATYFVMLATAVLSHGRSAAGSMLLMGVFALLLFLAVRADQLRVRGLLLLCAVALDLGVWLSGVNSTPMLVRMIPPFDHLLLWAAALAGSWWWMGKRMKADPRE